MTGLEGAGQGRNQLFSKALLRSSLWTLLSDMYSDGGRVAGHHQLPQPRTPFCQCPHCVHYDPPYPHRGGRVYRPTPTQTDHPSPDRGGDFSAPSLEDVGGRPFGAGRPERSGHRRPQRRPVFARTGPYGQPDDLSQSYPWDLNPAQWNGPAEPGARHCPSVREQCDCVVWGDAGTHPFIGRPLQPLPPPQFRGQVRHQRSVKYTAQDEQCWECQAEHYHLDPHAAAPQPGHSHVPNGHGGPRPGTLEGGDERDNHRDWSRSRGGSEERYNGRNVPPKAFFSTEVPQQNLKQLRRKGPCIPPTRAQGKEPLKPATGGQQKPQGSDLARQKGGQDAVRDQIRQVVTDLEDVLGGLKQVHVEMKEVVDQIDRLTANIDLGEEQPSVTQGVCGNIPHPGDHGNTLVPNHKPASAQLSQSREKDHIILRTNAPSPVHMAAVVKTNRIAPPGNSSSRDSSHDRHGMNGHLPYLYPGKDSNHQGQTQPEAHHPQSLQPTVIVANCISGPRTHKPPPYPHNGRCIRGQGQGQPPSALKKSPAYPGRGRQSASMV